MRARGSAGGALPEDSEILVTYGQSLEEHGLRYKIFDNEVTLAKIRGRWPDEAKELMIEIQQRLIDTKKETQLIKEIRLSREFKNLKQGTMVHAEFQAEWERILISMEEAGMSPKEPRELFREFVECYTTVNLKK